MYPTISFDVHITSISIMSSMEAYLKALVANDPSTLSISPNLIATEMAKPSDLTSGLWPKATKVGSYAFTVSDKETRQHGFVGLN